MGFQDMLFLPSLASVCTMFPENCDRGYILGTATCLMTMVGVSKFMLPVRYFRYN